MSRVGKALIAMPNGVTVTVKDNVVTVKGAKGELTQELDPNISLEIKEGEVEVTRANESKDSKAKHGLYRSLINNMIEGVTNGYTRKLELVGVGYKATNEGNVLDLALGYSHNIIFEIPSELKLTTETAKGKNPQVILEGIDKQLIGQVAAKIRSLRKPEPYKGKGVRYEGEYIRRKAGKAAGA
jgi:large subunit ribosomal protein L6